MCVLADTWYVNRDCWGVEGQTINTLQPCGRFVQINFNEAAVPEISRTFFGGSSCGILGYNLVNTIFVLLSRGGQGLLISHFSRFWGVVHLEDPFETKYAARLCTGAHFAALWQHLEALVSFLLGFVCIQIHACVAAHGTDVKMTARYVFHVLILLYAVQHGSSMMYVPNIR